MIRILTLANKPNYLPDAIASVLTQTRKDIIHVIGFDSARLDWGDRYPPAVFYNEETCRAPMQDYIMFLADDDILLPNCVEDLAGFLDTHPDKSCVYGRAFLVLWQPGQEPHPLYSLPRKELPVYCAERLPWCKIGSGMVMIRRSIFEEIEYPWMPEDAASKVARTCDGALLNAITEIASIYPIGAHVLTVRVTPRSAHHYCTDTRKLANRDWHETKKYDQVVDIRQEWPPAEWPPVWARPKE